MQIDEKIKCLKDKKTQQKEYARMANEMRVNSAYGIGTTGSDLLGTSNTTFMVGKGSI